MAFSDSRPGFEPGKFSGVWNIRTRVRDEPVGGGRRKRILPGRNKRDSGLQRRGTRPSAAESAVAASPHRGRCDPNPTCSFSNIACFPEGLEMFHNLSVAFTVLSPLAFSGP